MAENIPIPDDIDLDTLWFVIDGITKQVSTRGVQMLKEKLQSEGLELTEGLSNSLKSEVKSNTGWSRDLILEFWGYGRFADMKYTAGHGNMPGRKFVDNMKLFVQAVMDGKMKNSTPFTHIAGRVAFPADRQKAINSLAWALARGRLKSVIHERNNRGWYIRNYMKEIYGEIETNIQAAAAQATLNTIAKALKDRQ